MKRRDLTRRIAAAAKLSKLSWTLVRQGANHEVWKLEDLTVPVPRHREIGEVTAVAIFKECEPKLGEGWWR